MSTSGSGVRVLGGEPIFRNSGLSRVEPRAHVSPLRGISTFHASLVLSPLTGRPPRTSCAPQNSLRSLGICYRRRRADVPREPLRQEEVVGGAIRAANGCSLRIVVHSTTASAAGRAPRRACEGVSKLVGTEKGLAESRPSIEACSFCRGTGKCWKCGGTGTRAKRRAWWSRSVEHPCEACGGSGGCRLCRGTGRRPDPK